MTLSNIAPLRANASREPDSGGWPDESLPKHKALGKFQHSVSLLAWGHNGEHLIESFLNRAIELLDRTVDDWEIVFIDDCSTDRTRALLLAFAERECLSADQAPCWVARNNQSRD